MKKILLMIVLTLCIFQMVVLATVIEVGNVATTRVSNIESAYTMIAKGDAANASGKITSVEIYCYNTLNGCEVATFYAVDATHYTTRDYETVDNGNGAGVVLQGSKQTFTVDLDVEEGDLIGVWYTSGRYYFDSGGNDIGIVGDHIPCTNEAITELSITISLYGIGVTEEEANAIFMGTNF